MGSGATTGSYNGNGGGNGGSGGHGGSYIAPPTLGSQRKFMPGAVVSQKVATISQNYNEKTMLLSSDDEYQ